MTGQMRLGAAPLSCHTLAVTTGLIASVAAPSSPARFHFWKGISGLWDFGTCFRVSSGQGYTRGLGPGSRSSA